MKLKYAFSLFSALAFSRLFVYADAKESSVERHGRHANMDRRAYSRVIHVSSQANIYKHPSPPEKTTESTPVVVPSASSPSSSFPLPRRELRKDVAKNFKQCSDACSDGSVAVATTINDDCCAGGVSFLKMEFRAQDHINGTIAIGSSQSCESSYLYKGSKAGGYSKASSSSNSELRLVDCNDICIQKPFGGHPCDVDSVANEKDVIPGSKICIAMVRPTDTLYEYEVAFDARMEHNLHVLFLSQEGFSGAVIHTSCSKPLTLSWGVRFEDCNNSVMRSHKKKYEHVNISNSISNSSTPYLSFIDGISTEYFVTASDALSTPSTSTYARTFDIGFNNCGCSCERSNVVSPTLVPSIASLPSSSPSEGPTATPSLIPSLAPPTEDPTSMPTNPNPTSIPSPAPTVPSTSSSTSSSTHSGTTIINPGPGSPTGTSCNSACSTFVLQHCVFVGTNNACDLNAQVPVVADDDGQAEGGAAAPPLPSSHTENDSANTAENFGKGTKTSKGSGKGNKGFGKNGYGKGVEKGEKSEHSGKGSERSRKKGGKSTSPKGKMLTKHKKGKGDNGRKLFSDSEYERHLQKIEYHQSRIEYFEKLLMQMQIQV